MAKRKSKKSNVRSAAKVAPKSAKSGKRKMTADQEFQIMKLVLDKFLWLGFIVMGYGMYQSLSTGVFMAGVWYLLAGAILLLLFLWVIVKEFEVFENR